MLINLVVWAVFGGLAGWIASLVIGTDEQQGLIVNIIVGIIGAIIGGLIIGAIGGSGITGINIPSLIISVFGSIILLVIVQKSARLK